MQKALRINLLARNQAVKRAKKFKTKKTREEWADYNRQHVAQQQVRRSYLKEERTNRREDWMLGPLAPNRNVGKEKGKFGTISVEVVSNPELPKAVRASPRGQGYDAVDKSEEGRSKLFKGRTIVGNVVAGDIVVVVHGPERLRGQIGEVLSVDHEKEELKVKNVNINDVAVDNPLAGKPTPDDPNPSRFSSFEQPIPIRQVRLVVVDNDAGGAFIVTHVHADGPYMQRTLGSHLPSHTRYITGSESINASGRPSEIPWPIDHVEEEFRSTPADTGRDAVERGSWVPSVVVGPLGYDIPSDANLNEPMSAYTAGYAENSSSLPNPAHKVGLAGFSNPKKATERQARIGKGIMDELRSKYARLNTRHDDIAWVQRKIIEDARSIWWKDRQIQSPSQEQEQRVIKEVQEAREARIREQSERAEAVREARRAKQAAKIEAQNERQRLSELEKAARKDAPLDDAELLASAETATVADAKPATEQQVQAQTFAWPANEPAQAVATTTSATAKTEEAKDQKPRVALSLDTERLIRDMQKGTLSSVYVKPDRKFTKKLAHMEMQRQLGNTGRELRV